MHVRAPISGSPVARDTRALSIHSWAELMSAPLRGRVFEEWVVRYISTAKSTDQLQFVLDKIDAEEARWREADPEAAKHVATTRVHVEKKLAELTAERQKVERETAARSAAIERERARR